MKSLLTVIGTRPEAIKLAPVLSAIKANRYFESKLCITRQHTDLLDPFLLNLGITADYLLENDVHDGTLHEHASRLLRQLGGVFSKVKPDLVIIQGDTSTAFAATLAAFYSHIPIAHIEAGLRTGHLNSPWPEEAHRCMIDRLTTYYFVPTTEAQNSLLSEGAPQEKIWVVGNTSIDAMKLLSDKIGLNTKTDKKYIVVTVHRRENQGEQLLKICAALRTIAKQFPEIQIKFILHPNPAVRHPVINQLSSLKNIDLLEPLDHTSFISLISKSVFVVTDSGGIQEEVTYLGKPVLVTRNTTERTEGTQAGTAWLVGTDPELIVKSCTKLLKDTKMLASMSKVHHPYGHGNAAERIVSILDSEMRRNLQQ